MPASQQAALKKAVDISKSFKQTSQLNPNAISQSIRDAVTKLLPPPKFVSSSMQQPARASPVDEHQSLMSNTVALFNKLFSNNPSQSTKSQNKPQQPLLKKEEGGSNLNVYSTRMPQKKHFSSPDDLQMRLAARKNQHQQLAIATA